MGDVTLRLVVASFVGVALIAASIMGNLGSILGSLIDADHMVQGPPGYGGGDASSGLGSTGGYQAPSSATRYPGGAYAPNAPISQQP